MRFFLNNITTKKERKNIVNHVTYEMIIKNPEINTYIESGNKILGVLGYTDHSKGHSLKVAKASGFVLKELGYS